ncbi:MAG: hypothetical protein KJ626_14960 [Verrucomicrobia bacterium]|nr:hypothetical protein [Verrucomicrobiota bacterium]
MKRFLLILALCTVSASLVFGGSGRQDVLKSAMAAWQLGNGGAGAEHALEIGGNVKLDIPARGAGAGTGTVARLDSGWFDAGSEINVKGNQITVFLRLRDPHGQWMHALMAKRGTHETINFNLFSADFEHTQGPDIGFELHTDEGLATCSFPVSRTQPLAWHDMVGRYDGEWIELICDGVVMDRVRWRGNLTQNEEPLLIGAQTSRGEVEAPFTGEVEEAAVWSRALSDEEVAALSRKDSLESHADAPPKSDPYKSPIHYRPPVVKMGDTIPFYWDGEYHVYYLRATAKMAWGHIASTDLVNWTELPYALIPDGDPSGPAGENCGTGSIIEKDGIFHAYFTGWNPRNPDGREMAVHATSTNLIDWVKHPEHICAPDGVIYRKRPDDDFRDPYVFWNEEDECYWLLIFTHDARNNAPVVGAFTSTDLESWTAREPIKSFAGQECPDYFKIGDRHYLIGAFRYGYAEEAGGPYRTPANAYLETPLLYAGKRMFDGKRHVWTSWFRDLAGEKDDGAFIWGGSQCLPREVYAGSDGLLYMRPVDEVTAVFEKTVLDLTNEPPVSPAAEWKREDSVLLGHAERTGSQQVFDVPDNYMMQCRMQLDPGAEFTVVFREQEGSGYGYKLVIRPDKNEAEINSRSFSYPRFCEVDASEPITIQAFVQGSMIETFINDKYAFSCRAYDFAGGQLGLNVSGGSVEVQELSVKVHKCDRPGSPSQGCVS